MKSKLLAFSVAFCVAFSIHANTTIWKISSKKELTHLQKVKDVSIPQYAVIFNLNYSEFISELTKAPHRNSTTNKTSLRMSFPNLQGKMEQYSIEEAPVLHPDLAAKYPTIKSYVGYGINHSKKIRFSTSPQKGLSAIILGGKEVIYIEPYSANHSFVAIYSRTNNDARQKTFKCLTTDVSYQPQKGKIVNKDANDQTLRTFELAMSATGEYTAYHGGTKPQALAAMNATMTRVNGIYETDFAITMILIANTDDVIYTDASTDPYGSNLNSELQSTLTNVIGEANYDIGHLVHQESNSNGNAGCIGCVCVNNQKGSGFTSHLTPQGDDFDVDYVAHEMGHQFGANHTFTHSTWPEGTGAQMEPGSGSTIMGYAGITGASDVQAHSDAYFHFFSVEQVTTYISSTGCQVNTAISNNPPVANAGQDYTIPHSTAYILQGSATDTDVNDILTYCWEQGDQGFESKTSVTNAPNSGMSPSFRSLTPTLSSERYIPKLADVIVGNLTTQWETVLTQADTMNMTLTVRDNVSGGGQNNIDKIKVYVDGNSGPFAVTSQTSNVTWTVNTQENITWDVANTTAAPVSTANVDIFLSIDGGQTFPYTLATGVPNNGSASITVPWSTATTQARVMVKGSGNIFYAVNSSNFTIFSPTSIAENTTNKIKIFPNPAIDMITLDFGEQTHIKQLTITDVQGKVLYIEGKSTASTKQIEVTGFANGLYLLTIETSSGISIHKITIDRP